MILLSSEIFLTQYPFYCIKSFIFREIVKNDNGLRGDPKLLPC